VSAAKKYQELSLKLAARSDGLMDAASSASIVAGSVLAVASAGFAIAAELADARRARYPNRPEMWGEL